MREYKFRCWDTENKEMLKVQELDFEDTFYGGRLSIRTDQYNDYFDIEDMILMQYTGLKDKNGKEIYEEDIVKINDEIIAKVIWDNDYLGYFLYANEENSIDSFENGEQPLYDYWGSIEVIGNIYDNPELLEKDMQYVLILTE